ncbi:Cell division control protein 1 [Morus notabilis]|uniref:Cell division control protein 1 n=1 Tax=Morus notabilis TaxID=981085 RepID=W9RQF8_9ROSA|nr:Cell division control protein 1 [Morus notabilis]
MKERRRDEATGADGVTVRGLGGDSPIDGTKYPGDYVKIAVITDPQLMDRTSLSLAPKSLALEMAQFYTDLYMRRAFVVSILPFKPDVILYLGDYFDGGPYLSDEDLIRWQELLDRFNHIFALDSQGRHRDIKVYFLSGNHDIGYESIVTHRPEVVNRYEKKFGKRNYRFTAGKVEFIAIDAQTLDARHQQNLASSPLEFVKNVSMDVQSYPRVLLTHIPLYRQDEMYCGPNRKSPVINQRISRTADGEIRYQNYVSDKTSDFLLELIKPVLILSGHDHDQCTINHESTSQSVMELLSSLFSATKEKNEDLNCEYEMMWDAEGSMHLVKKLNTPIVTRSSEMNPERGSAVIRPTARKNSSQESDISLSVENSADIGSDHMTKLAPRASKSWRKIVIQRLLRTFLMLSIIAAVNVPLYIILLFKDWIDQ